MPYTLNTWLTLGDTTSVDETLARETQSLPKMREAMKDYKPDEVSKWVLDRFQESGNSEENKSYSDLFVEMFQSVLLDTLPERVKGNYRLYCSFCEQIVEKLLLEKYLYGQGK